MKKGHAVNTVTRVNPKSPPLICTVVRQMAAMLPTRQSSVE